MRSFIIRLDFHDPERIKTFKIGKYTITTSTRKLRVVFSFEKRKPGRSESGIWRAANIEKHGSGRFRTAKKDNATEDLGREQGRVGTSDGGSTIVESREDTDGDKCEIMDRMKILGV